MSENITKDQVKNIAKLANLSLSEEEIEKYSRQLSEVIDYNVKLLQKVDTEGVEPLLNVSGLTNSFREDQAEPGLTSEQALRNVKDSHNGFVKVKAILDQ